VVQDKESCTTSCGHHQLEIRCGSKRPTQLLVQKGSQLRGKILSRKRDFPAVNLVYVVSQLKVEVESHNGCRRPEEDGMRKREKQ
jgi:hypothetical protein